VFVRVDDGYVEARPADVTRPAIALWEHRAVVAALREAGRRAVDEELITILAQRALVDAAGAATKAARRQTARRAHLEPPAMIDVTPAAREASSEPAGRHIERLIGTMMGAAHLLPGSHFSNVRPRPGRRPVAGHLARIRCGRLRPPHSTDDRRRPQAGSARR